MSTSPAPLTTSRSRSAAPDEVRRSAGALVTVEDTECRNPAFDVTPAGLVSALVTERGVAQPVSSATVAALLAA